MRVLILTGPLGVGKSFLQERLRDQGYWCPNTITTRTVASGEVGLEHLDLSDFRAAVAEDEVVLPAKFGESWYGWRRETLHRLADDSNDYAVVNVRPYTALTLATLLPSACSVWLWLTPDELSNRIAKRSVERDQAIERATADEADASYEELFHRRVYADDTALQELLAIGADIRRRPGNGDMNGLLDVRSIQAHQERFAEERGWQRYHSAKNVAAALAVEAAELLEIFQWQRDDEATEKCRVNFDTHARATAELADVLIYALYFAHLAKIDVHTAIWQKFEFNAKKHVAGVPSEFER